MRTSRQRRGAFAESIAARWLLENGWQVVARNVRMGKDEIDIVALDPLGPGDVVCVEVRSARSPAFGTPEERVDARKVGNLYRAAHAFKRSELAGELGVGGMTARVDLLIVDLRNEPPQIRHLRQVEPV